MNENAAAIRREISDWLGERLNGKLEKLDADDPKYQALVEQFQYDNWIEDAARRVGQLQVVTHSLKPTHPDAKGSSVYAPPGNSDPTPSLLSTATLGERYDIDAVGNAGALDVFAFLNLQHDGKTILERVEEQDADLLSALSDESANAEKLRDQFAAITEPEDGFKSHSRAKQLYWLVGDEPAANEHFHLLAPLYATSLAHRIYQTIDDDRFSDGAKSARQARRDGKPFEHGFSDYPTIAVQRLGSTKPQGISHLNLKRRGKSYLFSCASPTWNARDVSPIHGPSAFGAYGRRLNVGLSLRQLGELLASDPRANVRTRNTRDALTGELVDELIVFTSEMHQLPAGWTADWHCRLPFEQQCWLDPHRAQQDPEFAERLIATDWLPTVCADFSRWLTGRLERYWKISMGDPEHRHFSREAAKDDTVKAVFETEYADWRATLEAELAALKEVLDDDDE